MKRIDSENLNSLKNIKSELESLRDQYNDQVDDFNSWQGGEHNAQREEVNSCVVSVLGAIRNHNRVLEEERQKIEQALEELNSAIDEYNSEAVGHIDELGRLACDMNEQVDECNTLLDDLKGEAEEYFDERSESWQESESGDSYQSFMDALDLELEQQEEPEYCPLSPVTMDNLWIEDDGTISEEISVCDEEEVNLEDLGDMENSEIDLDELEALIDNHDYSDY